MIVAVTPDALVVSPKFPFNLMFLPEVYGLEHNVPLSKIGHIDEQRARASNVMIWLNDGQKLGLKLRDPSGFVAALRAAKAT